MGADTTDENALWQALISKAGKVKMEERDVGRVRANGTKAKGKDTEARAEKDMAASKAKERGKDTEAKAYMVWIRSVQIRGELKANGAATNLRHVCRPTLQPHRCSDSRLGRHVEAQHEEQIEEQDDIHRQQV